MTSKPSSCSSAATTDESTPPDMATTTRVDRGGLAKSRLFTRYPECGSERRAGAARRGPFSYRQDGAARKREAEWRLETTLMGKSNGGRASC